MKVSILGKYELDRMVKRTISRYCPFKPCETTSWSTVVCSIFASVYNRIYKQWTKHWCVFVFTETADWKGVNNCDLCPTRAQQEEMARGALPPFCSSFPAFFFIFHQRPPLQPFFGLYLADPSSSGNGNHKYLQFCTIRWCLVRMLPMGGGERQATWHLSLRITTENISIKLTRDTSKIWTNVKR